VARSSKPAAASVTDRLKPAKIEPAVILLTPNAEARASSFRPHNIIDEMRSALPAEPILAFGC
jgi:hypothetical protein